MSLLAQSQSELKETRRQLLKEIRQTTDLLKNTKENRTATMNRYVTLRRQVEKREKLITTLNSEIALSDKSIDRTHIAVESMTEDVARLKEEYAEMLRTAYRQKLNNSTLLFLFSANNVNDMYRRYRYLKQYNDYRKKQATLIAETLKTLERKTVELEQRLAEKQELLASTKKQSKLLSKEMNAKNELLSTLKKDEKRLKKDLQKQRKKHEKLNKAIEGVITNEIVQERKRDREPILSKDNFRKNEELKSLSGSFRKNKGKLAMPVRGVITKYFGRQDHPTIKNITIDNPGIEIQTEKGTEVHAIFKGEVVGIQFVPGYNYMVILKHGEYYTVYSNLSELKVKKGDNIGTREVLGYVSTDRITGASSLHFEVWREKTRLNPTRWVN